MRKCNNLSLPTHADASALYYIAMAISSDIGLHKKLTPSAFLQSV